LLGVPQTKAQLSGERKFFFFNVEMRGRFCGQMKHEVVSPQKPTAVAAKQRRSDPGSHPEGAAACACDNPVIPGLQGLAALPGRDGDGQG